MARVGLTRIKYSYGWRWRYRGPDGRFQSLTPAMRKKFFTPRKYRPPPSKKYRRVSYGWSAGPDYGDYRVTKYVEEDQDPTISRGKAEKLLREGSDDPYNEWPYWSRGVKDYKSAVWATEDELVDESELPTGYKLGEWRYELYRGKGRKSSW